MKIVVLDGYTLNPGDLSWQEIEKLGTLTVYDRTKPEQTVERIGLAEAVFTNKTVLSAEVLNACKHLKFIGVLATGYNVVDLEAAKLRGITVCNVPAYSTMSVAQLTMGLLLEICHHIGLHDQGVHEGEWSRQEDFCYWKTPLIELDGKTFGIVGFGRIGKAVAKIVQAFGMHVAIYSRYPDAALESDTVRFVSLDELLRTSDVVSLHCPLSARTQGIINQKAIGKMKDGAVLINTGRGPLVVEADLAEALNSGKLYAAAVDVVSVEPILADNPLLQAKNCIFTPHIAWATDAARKRLMQISADNLKAFLEGRPIHVVS